MKSNLRSISSGLIFVLIFLISTLSSPAQRPIPTFTDRAPFDFSDKLYINRGVNPEAIIGRRNGMDGLSVFDKKNDTTYSNVRVLVTVPAYNQDGEPMFWYPLGELLDKSFTENKLGALARQTATLFPIYIFPDRKAPMFNSFVGMRHAPIIDNSWNMYMSREMNPVGLRQILTVTYTDKAFTKDGYETMQYMIKKNGWSSDDTPIIKSMADIQDLSKLEFIEINPVVLAKDPNLRGQFAIAPFMADPTKGTITPDAFIWMATKDGTTLPGEQIFVLQFGCLQKTGEWCL